MMALDDLIETAAELRRAIFRKCGRRGRTQSPVWMYVQGDCQSCAERELGIVL
jgi:hypothetical protein